LGFISLIIQHSIHAPIAIAADALFVPALRVMMEVIAY